MKRPLLVAGGLACLVFLPSLAGGFLYDDLHLIVNNAAIRDLGLLRAALLSEPSRPLLNLSWSLSFAAFGLKAWPWHLVNVLIHAGCAALVASLLLWMTQRSREPQPRAALLGACLFAVSPMAVETVAYVASRSTGLAALFSLAALRLAADLLESGFRPGRGSLALLFLAAALLTKEEAAAAPLLLLLLDAFFVAPRGAGHRSRAAVHAAFLGLPLVGFFARGIVTGAWLPARELDPARYVATQVAVFPLYLLRALLPFDPAFFRGHEPSPWPPDALTVAGWLATLALGVFAVLGRERWPHWAFAVAFLAAGLLPASSLVPLREMVVDHRAYLGSVGVCYALGILLARLPRGALAAVFALLCARTLHYEWVLADPVRAWQDATRRAPASPDAWRALGEAYAGGGDSRAEAALRRALALEPNDARSLTNLGAFYLQAGRLAEAIRVFENAAHVAPRDARVRDNLGLVLEAAGREAEALLEYEAAVAGQPALAQPRIRLAALLARRHEIGRAAALLAEARRLPLDREDGERLEAVQRELDALAGR